MVDWKEYGKMFGAQSLGWGLRRLFKEADKYFTIGTGVEPHEKVSTYLDVAGAILLPLGTEKMLRLSEKDQDLVEVTGTNLLSEVVWDSAEEYFTTTPAARREVSDKKKLEDQVQRTLKKTGDPGVSFNGRYRLVY